MKRRTREAQQVVGLALTYALLLMIAALAAKYVPYENAMPIYRPAKAVQQ